MKISLLSFGFTALVFTVTAKEKENNPLTKNDSILCTVQSIAKPNWWIQPATSTKPLGNHLNKMLNKSIIKESPCVIL